MSKLIINGGKPLNGIVKVSGSKNAALPLIAGSILCDETKLTNVPRIKDVESMLEIIAYLGGEYKWTAENEVLINAKNVESKPLPEIARKLRASILFAGPMLARFGRAELPYPGGDIIGARPLDTHINSFVTLGVGICPGESMCLTTEMLSGGRIVLEESSVTATENILLLASGIEKEVEIRLAASEPHVQNLCNFLVACGAQISGIGTTTLKINGRKLPLESITHAVIPDELEASAFSVLGAVTKSDLTIDGVDFEYLDSVLLQLEKMNVNFSKSDRSIKIMPPDNPYKSFRIQSGLYPKLVTDHLPPFVVLATQAEGTSLVHEWLYEARQSYIRELMKMGANAVIMDPHRALIIGPTSLYGKEVTSFDIRSGMTMVIAALAATGCTTITGVEHIDRGYEKLEERLKAIGADITRIND
jgi:UDP-N-acetylglucosamine 1-carboxyvinyltransferase